MASAAIRKRQRTLRGTSLIVALKQQVSPNNFRLATMTLDYCSFRIQTWRRQS